MFEASHQPGELKKLKRSAATMFQQTIQRPDPARHDEFAETILGAVDHIRQGKIVIDQIVFGSDRLKAMIADLPENVLRRELAIAANDSKAIQALLVAALLDGPDFFFVPTSKKLLIYSDHDDWVTFFCSTKGFLNRTVGVLVANGFEAVPDWRREF